LTYPTVTATVASACRDWETPRRIVVSVEEEEFRKNGHRSHVYNVSSTAS